MYIIACIFLFAIIIFILDYFFSFFGLFLFLIEFL